MRYGISATLIVAGCMMIIDPLSVHDAESEERTLSLSETAQSVHAITRSDTRAVPFTDRVRWASLVASNVETPFSGPEMTGRTKAREPSAPESSTPESPAPAQAEEARVDPGQISQDSVCDALVAAAREHDLPVGFFIRLIWQESRFSTWALSPVGAQGMAQFMPATASAMGLEDPFDPLQALPFSAKLLKELREQFGNLGLAAAAYNAGPGRVGAWLKKRRGLPEETRNYVTIITGHKPERWKDSDADNPLASRLSERVPCVQFDDTPEYIPNPRDKPEMVEDKQPKAKQALLARTQDNKRKADGRRVASSKNAKNSRRVAKTALASRVTSKRGGRKQIIIAVRSAGKKAGKTAGSRLYIAKAKSGTKSSSRVAGAAKKVYIASEKSRFSRKTRFARAE